MTLFAKGYKVKIYKYINVDTFVMIIRILSQEERILNELGKENI